VIAAIGGDTGGWSLYTRDGRLKYCYNWLGIQRYYAESGSALPAVITSDAREDAGG
jgi:arylsulfatase